MTYNMPSLVIPKIKSTSILTAFDLKFPPKNIDSTIYCNVQATITSQLRLRTAACFNRKAKCCCCGVRVVTYMAFSLRLTKAWSKLMDWQASHQGTVKVWGDWVGSFLLLWVQRITQGPWVSQKWHKANMPSILVFSKMLP